MGFKPPKNYPREDPKARTTGLYSLSRGDHLKPEDGMNIMEAVSVAAKEPFTSFPETASPVLAAFLRSFNEDCSSDSRVRLASYVPRLVKSRGTKAAEEARAWVLLNWVIRGHVYYWLGLHDPALAKAMLDTIKGSKNVDRDNVGSWPTELHEWRGKTYDYELKNTTGPANLEREAEAQMSVLLRTGAYAAGEYMVGAAIEGVAKAKEWDQAHAAAVYLISSLVRIGLRRSKQHQIDKIVEALEASVFKLLDRLLPLEEASSQ